MNEFLNYPRQYKVGSRIEQTFTNFLICKIGRISSPFNSKKGKGWDVPTVKN